MESLITIGILSSLVSFGVSIATTHYIVSNLEKKKMISIKKRFDSGSKKLANTRAAGIEDIEEERLLLPIKLPTTKGKISDVEFKTEEDKIAYEKQLSDIKKKLAIAKAYARKKLAAEKK